MSEQGQISINTENILPIIKKWLYSERDIFIRELVSNAADAIHKLEKLELLGEVKTETKAPQIALSVDSEASTITISDTGLGMSADEMKRYINQVAFSGITDFVEKFKDKSDEDQIIGHFGLGFYSSFMIASKVEIDSLSYAAGAKPAHWESSGDGNFILSEGKRTEIGTTITLHVNEADKDLLEVATLKPIVEKFCGFMKYPLSLNDEAISDTQPIWTKSPTELKDEDYKSFFAKMFPFAREPLFWIHLNVDYPFKLRGILFFPKLNHELEAAQGEVKLFCNQVFVENNCKQLLPEFLTLLKGAIDCPDLPLNVSRSALQKDIKVQKITQHIIKKVADKLAGLYRTDRENYEKYWADINPFVKYAMMRDQSFCDRMKEFVIFEATGGEDKKRFLTIAEYQEANQEKTEKKVIYTSDPAKQTSYIQMLNGAGIDVVIANRVLDQHFLPYLEMHAKEEFQFQRVDAEVSSHLINEKKSEIVDPADNKTAAQKLEDLFKKHIDREDLKIRVEHFKNNDTPAVLTIDENLRRLQEMSKLGHLPEGFQPDMKDASTLVINADSSAVKNLLSLAKTFNRDDELKLITNQIYDLASLQQGAFSPESMQGFIERSSSILAKIGANPNPTAN